MEITTYIPAACYPAASTGANAPSGLSPNTPVPADWQSGIAWPDFQGTSETCTGNRQYTFQHTVNGYYCPFPWRIASSLPDSLSTRVERSTPYTSQAGSALALVLLDLQPGGHALAAVFRGRHSSCLLGHRQWLHLRFLGVMDSVYPNLMAAGGRRDHRPGYHFRSPGRILNIVRPAFLNSEEIHTPKDTGSGQVQQTATHELYSIYCSFTLYP
jgi:hypothetical protein